MDDEELNPFEVLRAPIRYCFSLVKETDEHTTYVRNPGDRAAQQALCDKIRSLRHENPADDEEVKHNAMIDSGVRSIEEYHASELDEDSAWDPTRVPMTRLVETRELGAYARNPGDPAVVLALLIKLQSFRHENPADDKEIRYNELIESLTRSIITKYRGGGSSTADAPTETREAPVLSEENKKRAVISLILMGTSVPYYVYYGWTVKFLWDSFMPESVPRITTSQAVGLSVLGDLLFVSPYDLNKTWKRMQEEQLNADEMWQPAANRIIFVTASLIGGALIKRFMRKH